MARFQDMMLGTLVMFLAVSAPVMVEGSCSKRYPVCKESYGCAAGLNTTNEVTVRYRPISLRQHGTSRKGSLGVIHLLADWGFIEIYKLEVGLRLGATPSVCNRLFSIAVSRGL
uniref:Putative secretory peptide-14 n=1 Tax=Pleurobrachia bachei TaxID=34499 RepID=M4H2H8_PLEBA|nr:putative secretory peptide-14 [Pleurobrachia bachei]|eukprot:sb/3476902/